MHLCSHITKLSQLGLRNIGIYEFMSKLTFPEKITFYICTIRLMLIVIF